MNEPPDVSRAAMYHPFTDEERQAFIDDVTAMLKEYPHTIIQIDQWVNK
jgi:hypothetical protein